VTAILTEHVPHDRSSSAMRLVSLDTYRGLVMLLMASDGLKFSQVARHFPESGGWQFLALETDHVRWQGCHLWDLIMPAFLFMVGMSLPYSIASRRRRGQGTFRLVGHAIWRSLALVLLGILLMSNGETRTNFNFINVLAQIGLGYWLVFLLVERPVRVQLLALVLILVGYWYLFYSYPLPGPSFDYASVGVPSDWNHLEGVAAHWDLNTNPVIGFDRWFLNLFPRSEPFRFRPGGGGTLNFVPSIATMLLGVMAAQWLRCSRDESRRIAGLVGAGVLLVSLGVALDPAILPSVESTRWSLCPIVKCLWTPSYVLYSGGWAILGLALLYWIIDVRGARGWTFPFVVVGMNSLVMYLMAWFIAPWIRHTLYIHFGRATFETTYGPIIESVAALMIMWLVCLWLYRQRVFVRI
jgi:heparan-alpha-glucosaminide N-acetyltransferase